MTRYIPSRNYITAACAAIAFAVLSGWMSQQWVPSVVPAILFLVTSGVLFYLYFRPAVEIHPHHLRIGSEVIPWADIRQVNRTGWISPLVVFLVLADGKRVIVIYPGDLTASKNLLRQLRRSAHDALIDGIPYREFWGAQGEVTPPAGRYPILREEDEAEVERLYHRLKTVGHLDSRDEA